MRNFQAKKKSRRILESPPVLILFLVLVLIFAFNLLGFWGKMRITVRNREAAEERVLELKENQEELAANIAKLNTPAGVEETIREKFGLGKEGEGLIVIVEDPGQSEEDKAKAEGGFFSFFKKLFR